MISPVQSVPIHELPAALAAGGAPGAAASARAAAVAASRQAATLAIAGRPVASAKKKTTTGSTKKKRPSTGYASTAKKASSSGSRSTASKASGALAFLDDPRLSTEEKLFRFMMYVTERYDRDIEAKMKAAGGSGSSASGGSTSAKKKSSNPFSKIASAIKTVIPAAGIALETLTNKNLQSLVKTISGPALAAGATALGMPALAPLLAKVGPQLASVTFDLAKALDDPGTSTTSTGGSSGSGSTSTAGGDPEIDRRKVMELQYAMDKQKEMFSLVSNILRSMHDMKMVAVQNLRS